MAQAQVNNGRFKKWRGLWALGHPGIPNLFKRIVFFHQVSMKLPPRACPTPLVNQTKW